MALQNKQTRKISEFKCLRLNVLLRNHSIAQSSNLGTSVCLVRKHKPWWGKGHCQSHTNLPPAAYKQSETDRVPIMGVQHNEAGLEFAREHQIWQVCQCLPVPPAPQQVRAGSHWAHVSGMEELGETRISPGPIGICFWQFVQDTSTSSPVANVQNCAWRDSKTFLGLCVDVTSWRAWTSCATWRGCRNHLMLPAATRIQAKTNNENNESGDAERAITLGHRF